MEDKEKWNLLIGKVKEVLKPRTISPFIEAGQVGAAIMTKNGNVYTGVCVDTASTLGICAERNAIHTMITNGENEIERIVCLDSDGNALSPCGACRELIMQLNKNSKDVKFLINSKTYEYICMEELIPNWWGYNRFDEKGD